MEVYTKADDVDIGTPFKATLPALDVIAYRPRLVHAPSLGIRRTIDSFTRAPLGPKGTMPCDLDTMTIADVLATLPAKNVILEPPLGGKCLHRILKLLGTRWMIIRRAGNLAQTP